jgi:hypothetical protein
MAEKEPKEGIFYELEVAKKEGANLLMPSTHIAGLSEFHAPVVEKVVLSADPKDGDVYPHSSEDDENKQKFRLTKQALMKLSVCAGIIWSVGETKRLDNRSDRNYCAFAAVGGIKKADGQPVFFRAEYDIDFEVVEEELRESYEAKAKKYKKDATAKEKADYVEFCVKRDMLQKRKHKLKLAEAGAMNRVVREILGLKNAYTKAELEKPFVMVRIVFRPDYNDKEVKKQLIAAHIQSMTGIYGKQVMDAAIQESEPIDITPEPNGDELPEKELEPEKEEAVPSAEERQIVDFQNGDVHEQAKSLTILADRKGYDLPAFLQRSKIKIIAELTPGQRVNLFKNLLNLQDKAKDDDIPF